MIQVRNFIEINHELMGRNINAWIENMSKQSKSNFRIVHISRLIIGNRSELNPAIFYQTVIYDLQDETKK